MTNLLYFTQNPERIALDIEALLCQELQLPIPLSYQILPPERLTETVGFALDQSGQSSITPLCHIYFKETRPQVFELLVTIIPWAQRAFKTPGAFAEIFTYIVPLARPVDGSIKLEGSKVISSQFTGEVRTTAFLNADQKLLAQARRLTVNGRVLGNTVIMVPQYLHFEPYASGSALILRRLGKPGFFSGVNIGAKDLFAFISRFEATFNPPEQSKSRRFWKIRR